MIIPVRCFTCGSLIADKQADFISRVKNGEGPDKVLEDLEVKRYCCRRMLLSSIDVIDELIPYFEALYRRHAEFQTDKF